MLTAPLIDSFGTSAWDNMLRQTQLLIHTMNEYRGKRPTEVGGLARVMNQIKDQVKTLKARIQRLGDYAGRPQHGNDRD